MVAVLSIVAVVSVYAVLIGSFTGGDVTVGGMGSGNLMYNVDNLEAGSWTSTLDSSGVGVAWYSRLEIDDGGYAGPVTITWKLQQETATWTDVPGATQTTTITLTGGVENVYASGTGVSTGNHDWGAQCLQAGTYRVIVSVESA
jgi:hypothetical protein